MDQWTERVSGRSPAGKHGDAQPVKLVHPWFAKKRRVVGGSIHQLSHDTSSLDSDGLERAFTLETARRVARTWFVYASQTVVMMVMVGVCVCL